MWNDDNKLVIITEGKTICYDLFINVDNSLKDEISSVIKRNEFTAVHRMKNNYSQLLSKYKHGNDIHKHGKQ